MSCSFLLFNYFAAIFIHVWRYGVAYSVARKFYALRVVGVEQGTDVVFEFVVLYRYMPVEIKASVKFVSRTRFDDRLAPDLSAVSAIIEDVVLNKYVVCAAAFIPQSNSSDKQNGCARRAEIIVAYANLSCRLWKNASAAVALHGVALKYNVGSVLRIL